MVFSEAIVSLKGNSVLRPCRDPRHDRLCEKPSILSRSGMQKPIKLTRLFHACGVASSLQMTLQSRLCGVIPHLEHGNPREKNAYYNSN